MKKPIIRLLVALVVVASLSLALNYKAERDEANFLELKEFRLSAK